MQILFPQIEKPLPPVWGIGEPLAINSRVNADDIPGDNISAPQLKAAEKTLDITVSNLTPVSIEHTFGDKGKVDVSITFGSETADKISASRGIKIVDYREENVALFNGLVDLLAAKGVAVNRTMTAREIEGKLQDKYPSLVQSDLADIVRGFEFANYSLRPVARRVYVEMYLAIEKIREKLNAA